jgi:hypothetical protein
MILLISASIVAKITFLSHRKLVLYTQCIMLLDTFSFYFLENLLENI